MLLYYGFQCETQLCISLKMQHKMTSPTSLSSYEVPSLYLTIAVGLLVRCIVQTNVGLPWGPMRRRTRLIHTLVPIQLYSMRSGLKVYKRSASLIRSNHPRTCKFLQGLLSKMLELYELFTVNLILPQWPCLVLRMTNLPTASRVCSKWHSLSP